MPISEEDKIKIAELRERVKEELTPYYDTDYNLLRWLKGHDYNFDLIVPKLKNHLMFRKSDWNLDALAKKPRDHPVHRHWKAGLTGEALLTPNVIVNIEQTGGNDYWGLLHTHPINEVLRARVHDLESMLAAVMQMEEKTGEQCAILYIMDLTGIKMDRKLPSLLTGGLASISAFMAEHYVEMIHKFVLVNVPSFISTIWTISRPLLPEKTRNKVEILGSNWKDDVLNMAASSCLPRYWNDGDNEVFLADVERGLSFPTEGYWSKPPPDCATLLTVPAGKTGYFDVHAKEGSILRWEIHGDGHFAFCIYKGQNNDDVTNGIRAYPLFSKIPGPTLVPCIDQLRAPETGYYRFWFGNQHAWFHALKIRYIVNTD